VAGRQAFINIDLYIYTASYPSPEDVEELLCTVGVHEVEDDMAGRCAGMATSM
jgi:hypothetical protein